MLPRTTTALFLTPSSLPCSLRSVLRYEYQCDACQRVFEVRQRISEEPLAVCEVCGGHVRRLLSAAPFILKGDGWYVTDYPSASRKKAMESEKSSTTTTPSTEKSAEKSPEKSAEKSTTSSEKSTKSSEPSSSAAPAPSTSASSSPPAASSTKSTSD